VKHDRTITVGVPTDCLSETHPRGVIRAARAVMEQLVSRPGLHLLAISELMFEAGELICECRPLAEWLDEHPIRRSEFVEAATLRRRVVSVGRRVLSAVGLKRLGKLAYRTARHAIRFSKPAPAPSIAAPALVSVRDLDAVLSFECYDPIWQWPLESYGCRMIGVFHDAIPFRIDEGAGARPDEYLRAAGLLAMRAALVCCDSANARTDLETFFPAARGRARVIPLGHDAERFRTAEPHRPRAAGKRIAMIGDIEARKNQAGVLRAARFLAAAHPNEPVTLLLIGRPRTPDPLEFLIHEAGRYIRIERTGYMDDDRIPAVLAGCDCFVYPSLWEGFGIPVLEAMSAGVPVVCSDTSSLPEVAGPHAFYCDPYDPRSIAAAVNRALALSVTERATRIAAARSWAARFTWTATADRFHEALIETTARESTSPRAATTRRSRDERCAVVPEPGEPAPHAPVQLP
jgi:glycosyltransferase involved in cell wall biosynthesis